MQAATNTSVGQWTPNTNRDVATRDIHIMAINNAGLRMFGLIRLTQRAVDVAKAATSRVCPLGKLEPQYHSVSHSVGRARLTNVLTM